MPGTRHEGSGRADQAATGDDPAATHWAPRQVVLEPLPLLSGAEVRRFAAGPPDEASSAAAQSPQPIRSLAELGLSLRTGPHDSFVLSGALFCLCPECCS